MDRTKNKKFTKSIIKNRENFSSNKIILKKKIIKKKNNFSNFFKPSLVSCFPGHRDGIICIEKHPNNSFFFFSGSFDGEIKFWLTHREKCIHSILGHKKFVRGLSIDYKGKNLLSCSDDETIKMWKISEPYIKPQILYYQPFTSISTHPQENLFLTGGKQLIMWDQAFFRPIQKLIWGISSISSVKFNPIEGNVICSASSNSLIILNDLRANFPIKKISMEMSTNEICWNSKSFSEFSLANDDSNIYTFDLRNLKKPTKIHSGHLMSVLCLDRNHSDQIIASGSEDNTIRIFDNSWSKTLDIFFSQRMKRVSAIKFSLNGEHIISGSEDGNIRIWKIKFFENQKFNFFFHFPKLLDDSKYFKLANFYDSFFFNYYKFPKLLKNLIYLKKILSKSKKTKKKNQEKFNVPGYLKFDLK
jgi:WD repeat and SOF domain-containing protein 1